MEKIKYKSSVQTSVSNARMSPMSCDCINKRLSCSTFVFLNFRSVQFNEEVEVKTLIEGVAGSNPGPSQVVEISEEKIDHVMNLLHEADPVSYNVLMI